MRFHHLVLALLLLATGCQAMPDTPAQTAIYIAPTRAAQISTSVDFTHAGVSVSLPKPDGWESFSTEYGVVIAQHFGTVADQGLLQGLMAYVFVASIGEFPTQDSISSANRTQQVLAQIVDDASFVGTAKVSTPIGFIWDGNPAAYYLLTDQDSKIKTVVIGVAIPETQSLVVGTVSAPLDEADTIRPALFMLFSALTVNGTTMKTIGLDSLPEQLSFP